MILSKRVGQLRVLCEAIKWPLLWFIIITFIYGLYLRIGVEDFSFEINGESSTYSLPLFLWHIVDLLTPFDGHIEISQGQGDADFASKLYAAFLFLPLAGLLTKLTQPIAMSAIGVHTKTINLNPRRKGRSRSELSAKRFSRVKKWLELERESRVRDYRKLFDGKKENVPESVLDDSDLECEYRLVIVYHKPHFFADPWPLASARIYFDPFHISKEIGPEIDISSSEEPAVSLVDRLAVCASLSREVCSNKAGYKLNLTLFTEILLVKLYCAIVNETGKGDVFALARITEREELLKRYSKLHPTIHGITKYMVGERVFDFRVMEFKAKEIRGHWSEVLPYWHELVREIGD